MKRDVKRGTATPGTIIRNILVLIIVAGCLSARQSPRRVANRRDVRAMLNQVSGDSLRGHLSFIASDALEGRNTPSRGLDIAAEYIAAQFRRAGLEPAGDDSYFQSASFVMDETPMDAFELKLKTETGTIGVAANQVSFNIDRELILEAVMLKLEYADASAVVGLEQSQVEGKVVITEIPDSRRAEGPRRLEMFLARQEFLTRMTALKAALVVSIDRSSSRGAGAAQGRLTDPEDRRGRRFQSRSTPVITVYDPRVVKLFDELKTGAATTKVELVVPAPVEQRVRLRNVIGVLRGSDPILRDSYVLLTAHYDHLGTRAELSGDNIFNGANDDGSGTVSVIELASALATLRERPKRSIVFMTFFGEEKGLLGSRYYGRHPVYPIDKTVANINLEQVGRTDSSEGPQLANASLTGFDYSDVGTTLEAAGELVGIKVYKHQQNSDSFFDRSDNQALADQGVPAHTLCTAFVYPDYHGAGDHWDKIDYANMEKVDRMVALALVMIADNPNAPKWNEADPRTARFVKAWNSHHRK
jgi:Peptidase family M28